MCSAARLSTPAPSEPLPTSTTPLINYSSAEALQAYLRIQIAGGKLKARTVEVFDTKAKRDELFERYRRAMALPAYGWVEYHILYRLLTLWEELLRGIRKAGQKTSDG